MADSFIAPILYRVQNQRRFCGPNEIVESIRSNIENLLNTRLSIPGKYILRQTDTDSLELLNRSLVNYGVVDFQSLNMGDPAMEQRFCESVRQSITRYEPRLVNVRVNMESGESRLLATQVTGQLAIEPFDEIRFESGLDSDARSFVVSG